MEASWPFPGSPVVKTQCLQYRVHRFSPWLGIKLLVSWSETHTHTQKVNKEIKEF